MVYYFHTWQHYLLGSKFAVKIDNVATSYSFKQKKLTPTQIRWQALLAEFDFCDRVQTKQGRLDSRHVEQKSRACSHHNATITYGGQDQGRHLT